MPVKRGMRARVRALDFDGKPFEIEGEELFARALQHESDHLIGRLLIDMVGPVKRGDHQAQDEEGSAGRGRGRVRRLSGSPWPP